MGFSLTILALLARLRVLVQQVSSSSFFYNLFVFEIFVVVAGQVSIGDLHEKDHMQILAWIWRLL